MAKCDRRTNPDCGTRAIHMGGVRPTPRVKNNVLDDPSVRELLALMEMARQDRHRGKKKKTDWRGELKGLFGGG